MVSHRTTPFDPIDLLLKGMHCLANGHRFGATWVQTRPKGNPNRTKVDYVHQIGQRNLLGPPTEGPGPVLGEFGPFWARLGPAPRTATRAWSTSAAGTWAFQVPRANGGGPNTIPDSVVTFFLDFGTPAAPGPKKGREGLACGLLACLLGAQAPPWFPNNLINRLKHYVLQLGDPNPHTPMVNAARVTILHTRHQLVENVEQFLGRQPGFGGLQMLI